MPDTTDLFTVTKDAQVKRDVTNVVETSAIFATSQYFTRLDDLAFALQENEVSAIIVDIDDHPSEMLADVERLLARLPYVRLIVTASKQSPESVIQAMQAGARHFLLKSAIDTDLPGVLRQLTPLPAGGDQMPDRNTVITILSAGGGCGATMLAVNLAGELYRMCKRPSLLVDLDCSFGGAAGCLGVTARYGIADVLADAKRIDANQFRTTAAPYQDPLHQLASPAPGPHQEPDAMQYEHLNRALRSARDAYEYIVVDAPKLPFDLTVELARASDLVLIVLELNTEDIRIARLSIKALVDHGISTDRILALANRYRRRRQMVPWAEAKQALDIVRLGRLRNDYVNVATSINFGKLLADIAPRSPVRRDIQKLARAIHNARHNGQKLKEMC